MIFIYHLKKQQEYLKKYTAEVAARKKQANIASVPECRQALENAMHSYALYAIATQSFWGKIKSHLPFTAVFEYRVRCARDIDNAFALLKQVDDKARQIIGAVTPGKPLIVNGSSHDLPTIYGSPIHTGRKKQINLSAVILARQIKP